MSLEDKKLEELFREAIKELKRFRTMYAVIWIPVAIANIAIWAKMAGLW